MLGSKVGPETDLTLMRLGPTEIAGLSDDDWWDYQDQLQHHCIRLAWKKAVVQGLPVRECLNVIYGRQLIASERSRGNAIGEPALQERLEKLRRYHELVLCLGFFVDAEADRIMRGAERPSYPSNLSIFTPKDIGLKQGQHSSYILSAYLLGHLRKILAMKAQPCDGEYGWETIRIVGSYAKSPNHASTSPRLDQLLDLAHRRAAAEMALAKAGKAHVDGRLRS